MPDGIGAVVASRILKRPQTDRIIGIDTCSGILRHLDFRGGSDYDLGSTGETLSAVADKLLKGQLTVTLAGTVSPPFKASYNAPKINLVINSLNTRRPDTLHLSFTAPKRGKLVADMWPRPKIECAGAVGPVFDFYSGKIKRLPIISHKAGLEWLRRLMQ